MKFLRKIFKSYLNCFQILNNNVQLPRSSPIKFYSICSIPSPTLNDRENVVKNFLNVEQKSIYYIEDGLRKVYPFHHRFSMFCKQRWRNKNVVDAFCNEYALYPREEIVGRISRGMLKVNDKIIDTNYVLKSGDLMTCTSHRHELAVLACPIDILFEDDDLLVVNKPPSMPVHPCGLYFYNSLLSILANDYNKCDLYILYRLDRLTSGILLFAKSSEKSREIHGEINMRNIKKEYVCRVEGNFPDGTVLCNKPIKHFYYKLGISIVHPEGKISVTEFKKLSYNGNSSVVLCKPYTGRTHQIRAHLQFLGHPIINDPIYNSFVFGPFKGKNGVLGMSISQLMEDLHKEHASEWGLDNVSTDSKVPKEKENFLQFSIFKKHYCMDNKLPYYRKDCSKVTKDENCFFCKTATQDPEQNSLGMFLHAYKYETDCWKFESNMPFWASENWTLA